VVGGYEARSSTGGGPAVTSPAAARAAWSLVALALALTIAGRVISAPGGERFLGHDVLAALPWLAILAAMAVVGALVASREPRNPIAWILLALPIFGGLVAAAEGYLERYRASGEG